MRFLLFDVGWVNMALVTHILRNGTGVRLYFAAPQENPYTGATIADYIDLDDEDVKRLEKWLHSDSYWAGLQ